MKKEAARILKKAGIEVSEESIEVPKIEFGDLSFPCFKIAKELGKKPFELAEEISSKCGKNKFFQRIEAKNGYVNFFFNYENLIKYIFKRKFRFNSGRGKRILIEFSSPNPAHPLHIGHARSTFLGYALSKLLETLGYKVIKANYINDLGLQVAKLVYSYLNFGKREIKGKPDFWIWDYYVKYHELAKKENLERETKDLLRRYEIEKDKEIVKVWDWLVKVCLKGFEETYENFGIKFDVYFYEHDFRELGRRIVKKLLNKKIAFKDESGAVIADLENYGLSNIVLLRSDGTGLYITSDLGLTYHKFKKFKLEKALWVVANDQELYFKQLFKLLELLGYKWFRKCYHVSFQLVKIEEGKMSSREGKAITLDEVFQKLEEKVLGELEKRNIGNEEKIELAKKIARSCLKYWIVKFEPKSEIVFDWEKILSFEGSTAAYLQYTYVRALNIVKKSEDFEPTYKFSSLNNFEKELLRKLAFFEDELKRSALSFQPHIIANYTYELSSIFNSFYQNVRVLQEENEVQRNFRLTLIKKFLDVMEKCFEILGIEKVERM